MSISRYLQKAMRTPQLMLDRIKRNLEGLEYDAIAVCGTSGIILATPACMMLGKQLVIVRKEGENLRSHAENLVEGDAIEKIDTYVIVDDLVSTGKTISHISKQMKDAGAGPCAGIYCYNGDILYTPDETCFQCWMGTGKYEMPLWKAMEINPPKWQTEGQSVISG